MWPKLGAKSTWDTWLKLGADKSWESRPKPLDEVLGVAAEALREGLLNSRPTISMRTPWGSRPKRRTT
eukprot:11443708-Alexandrium_andersonii.AAC.1